MKSACDLTGTARVHVSRSQKMQFSGIFLLKYALMPKRWQKVNILKTHVFSTNKSDSNGHVTYQTTRDIVDHTSNFFYE